jgi:hypothetical protein
MSAAVQVCMMHPAALRRGKDLPRKPCWIKHGCYVTNHTKRSLICSSELDCDVGRALGLRLSVHQAGAL